MKFFKVLLFFLCCGYVFKGYAQQEPQYTQYMYNTMIVNPAFTGTQGYPAITFSMRTQWLGFEGAPNTQNLSFQFPVKTVENLGVGFNITNDAIGPLNQIYFDANTSYSIKLSDNSNLALGLKLGGRYFSIDYSKLDPVDSGEEVMLNVSKFFATTGLGLYYYTSNFYFGIAVPNFLPSKHYKKTEGSSGKVANDQMHFYSMLGYVLDLNDNIKFKPSALIKTVTGAPVSIDLSLNFLINTKFHAGLSFRLRNTSAFLLGFQVNDNMYLGYTYDLNSYQNNITNKGSHELVLRYEFDKVPRRLKCSNSGLLWF